MKQLLKVFLVIMAVFLLVGNVFGDVKVEASPKTFNDVPKNYWGYNDISWAISKGFIVGYSDGSFKPNNLLTESQYVAVMTRYFSPGLVKGVASANQSNLQYKYLKDNGIVLPGYSDKSQRNKPITRLNMAKALYTSQGLSGTDKDVIDWMYINKLTTGKGISSDKYINFGGSDNLTRVHLAAFFNRSTNVGIISILENGKPVVDKPVVNKPYEKEMVGGLAYDSVTFSSTKVYNNSKYMNVGVSKYKEIVSSIAEKNGLAVILGDRGSAAVYYEDLGTEDGLFVHFTDKYIEINNYKPTDNALNAVVEELLFGSGLKGAKGSLSNYVYKDYNNPKYSEATIILDYHGIDIQCNFHYDRINLVLYFN